MEYSLELITVKLDLLLNHRVLKFQLIYLNETIYINTNCWKELCQRVSTNKLIHFFHDNLNGPFLLSIKIM